MKFEHDARENRAFRDNELALKRARMANIDQPKTTELIRGFLGQVLSLIRSPQSYPQQSRVKAIKAHQAKVAELSEIHAAIDEAEAKHAAMLKYSTGDSHRRPPWHNVQTRNPLRQ
jgi:hypothetical protein